jgi:sulfite reductase beta subunit-like hemoprotein
VTPEHAAAVCAEIALIYRDHGPRVAQQSRLLLIADWGRSASQEPARLRLPPRRDTGAIQNDHIGLLPEAGLNYLGSTPGGRDGRPVPEFAGC